MGLHFLKEIVAMLKTQASKSYPLFYFNTGHPRLPMQTLHRGSCCIHDSLSLTWFSRLPGPSGWVFAQEAFHPGRNQRLGPLLQVFHFPVNL